MHVLKRAQNWTRGRNNIIVIKGWGDKGKMMTSELEDCGEIHIVVDISLQFNKYFVSVYYGLHIALGAKNSSGDKGDKNSPAHMKLVFWHQER